MNKILKGIIKNYKTLNITILSLSIYILIIYPLITNIVDKVAPSLNKCSYLQLTGKPCPLCGGTRFLKNIDQVFVDIRYVFNIFGIIILVLIMEVIFRIINLIKKQNNEKIIIADIIIHIALIISYIAYAISFIMK